MPSQPPSGWRGSTKTNHPLSRLGYSLDCSSRSEYPTIGIRFTLVTLLANFKSIKPQASELLHSWDAELVNPHQCMFQHRSPCWSESEIRPAPCGASMAVTTGNVGLMDGNTIFPTISQICNSLGFDPLMSAFQVASWAVVIIVGMLPVREGPQW
jgi:hypothetical protein